MTRHLLRDDDLTPAEQAEVLALAVELKAAPYDHKPLAGPRTVAMIFDKPTLRTQTSFSAGIAELGGNAMVINGDLAQIGVRESVEDVARVLAGQVAQVVWRTNDHARLETMAAWAGIPVINALSDDFHPCQLLADLLTVIERKGPLAGLRATFVGDGACNMGNSWLIAGATAGMHVVVSSPEGYEPSESIVGHAAKIAAETGGSVGLERDPVAAVAGADIVITDTWVSMGKEAESADRLAALAPYSLTSALLAHAKSDAIAMHCLPAYRGKEIEAELIDGPDSVVWQEAENRRHAQKAVMMWLEARR
ncbi:MULTISPECIES: ornithine carbamoyltransferase [unclassified Nocardioides]|uniref:ornithine carbamoyltransferase n=1 Tax=unclassified Nocardioides TaxID=2615069 RepID=UPI0006F8A42B|nr:MULTISPECIES: ornithine carbamoyltransferase [unclassified Nocardioides]KQY54199.1 ornithine carbamoyltransferase [Nocardioides sp. Root140]KQZ74824.1 ornithine carbamoyltransferase [Nocardioides sp. Root151]KRF10329.1 ornithine carbamoyltransferase [Nocardioides sp. Soil796]